MGLNVRDPPPPEANPNVPLRPVIVLEYWPPVENMLFRPGSAILLISVKGRNYSNTPLTEKDEEIIHGSLEIHGEKDKAGTENYLFKIDNLQFHVAARDAVWNLRGDLMVDGVKLHHYDFPGIHVHGEKLPPGNDVLKAQKADESRAMEEFKEKVAEAKKKLADVTLMW